jgi:hypothetical protein
MLCRLGSLSECTPLDFSMFLFSIGAFICLLILLAAAIMLLVGVYKEVKKGKVNGETRR